ncbi:unnamed protein product [Pleuronectes platessa]|uniref:Uncharacterized protein n=1 Tax=Pleuronectes platessa TaxID=8262 RepID=A0A9N7Z1W8_PLEPL|nr:unnamed protein product [Pleuronectes platessa]
MASFLCDPLHPSLWPSSLHPTPRPTRLEWRAGGGDSGTGILMQHPPSWEEARRQMGAGRLEGKGRVHPTQPDHSVFANTSSGRPGKRGASGCMSFPGGPQSHRSSVKESCAGSSESAIIHLLPDTEMPAATVGGIRKWKITANRNGLSGTELDSEPDKKPEQSRATLWRKSRVGTPRRRKYGLHRAQCPLLSSDSELQLATNSADPQPGLLPFSTGASGPLQPVDVLLQDQFLLLSATFTCSGLP